MSKAESPISPARLDALFNPRSIVIVGASEKSTWTAIMRECLVRYEFDGDVYAVNRAGATVFGWPGFTDCSAIGKHVDAAYVCVPIEGVPDVLEDLARAGIRAAVVLSSGYAEMGHEGVLRQRALAERANVLGISLLGPNCLGFANIAARTGITAIRPRFDLLPGGKVSFVCQSGAIAAEIFEFTQFQGVAVNFFAATGNEAQISIADVVNYLVDEPSTRVIAVFAESIRNTDRFGAAARRALAAGKPVIALKVGSSEISASVAKAHTGSMVGDDRVFTGACQQLGVIRVQSLEDLVATASFMAQTGPLAAGGAGVVSISGGACGLLGDQAERVGLPLPVFAEATRARLHDVLPDYASTLNPLDITGAYVRDPALLDKALTIIADDPGVSLRLCVMNLPYAEGMTTPTPAMLDAVGRGLTAGGSPGLLVMQTIKPVNDISRRLMREHGIPGVIGGLDHTVRAAGRAFWWSQKQRENAAAPGGCTGQAVTASLEVGASSEHEVLAYLRRCGVPVVPTTLTQTVDEALDAAAGAAGPVVLKIASPDIAHKTEIGGVKLNIEGEDAIRSAWNGIVASARAARPEARIDGVLVAPMLEKGLELLVGVASDPDWGRVLAVGLGGVWVEALKDTALRVLPVTEPDVIEMLGSLRAAKLLGGFRGLPAADLSAVAKAVVRIGEAALALPGSAAALEVNPLFVNGSSVRAVDALVVWD